MSRAVIESSGTVRKLDRPATADERTTAKDVQDAETLARIVQELRDKVARLERAFAPRTIDFADVAVSTSGTAVRLSHGFGGRVRWSVVGWQTSGTSLWNLKEDTSASNTSTLVLLSYVAGTAVIRLEEAG